MFSCLTQHTILTSDVSCMNVLYCFRRAEVELYIVICGTYILYITTKHTERGCWGFSMCVVMATVFISVSMHVKI